MTGQQYFYKRVDILLTSFGCRPKCCTRYNYYSSSSFFPLSSLQDEEEEGDQLPPLGRDSHTGPQFHLEDETKQHTFQIGPAMLPSQSDANLYAKDHHMHRSHSIMDTIRRIGSRDNIHAIFHRNHSHVSLHDPKEIIQDRARKICRNGSRPFKEEDVEVFQQELTRRASQLKMCASHPAFERIIQGFDEEAEVQNTENRLKTRQAYITFCVPCYC